MCKVSVIIPTYNRCEWLQEAIDSVLAQRGIDFECIVVDDGSTDGTMEILEKRYAKKIRYLSQKNQGTGAARNFGAANSNGEYLAFLDSDDLWMPNKLLNQTKILDDNHEIAGVFCLALGIDENGNRINRLPYGYHHKGKFLSLSFAIKNGLPFGGSTLMLRKKYFQQTSGFDTSILQGEDYDFYINLLADDFKIAVLRSPLTIIRSHSKSQSFILNESRMVASHDDHVRIFEKLLTKPISVEASKNASEAILNHRLRLFTYYTYINNFEKANQIVQVINPKQISTINKEDYFMNQISYFTPLIFAENFSQKDLLNFIQNVATNWNREIGSINPYTLSLTIIKTSVWCANRGEKLDRQMAWDQIMGQIRKHPGIIFKFAFWEQLVKILLGKLIIRLANYQKWSR